MQLRESMQICIRDFDFFKTAIQHFVINKDKYRSTAIMKVSALACVYALHLLFFQAAMSAPDHGAGKYLKTFLSKKADAKKGKASPAGYYLSLIKLTNHGERPSVSFPLVGLTNLDSYKNADLREFFPVSRWLTYAHLPDDAFKIYQRVCSILI